jgi:hypothetical protein
MSELPIATLLATDAVRRQFDPTAPAEPERPPRSFRAVRRARTAAAAALQRAAQALEPGPECTPAR